MINVTPKQLKAFVTVAEHKSFAEASLMLHLSQPALSMAIKNLEQCVGGQLLVRTTRRLALSPEGQTFLPVAKRLLDEWDMALNDLHNLFAKQRGKLTVAAMPSFAAMKLPKALAEFTECYPNVNILIEDVVAEQVNDQVLSGRAEIGVTFEPDDESGLAFLPLFEDCFVVAVPGHHALAEYSRLTWNLISQYPLLLLQRPSAIRAMIDKTLRENGLVAQVEMEAHHLATLGQMVASGLGVSIVPTLYAPQLIALGAVCRPLVEPAIARHVGVIYRQKTALSAAAKAMIDVLQMQCDV